MITRHFPIFILCAVTLLAFCSCEKSNEVSTDTPQYNTYISKAENYLQKQRYDSAFFYFNKAKRDASVAKTSDKVVYALIRMSFIQQIQSDFSGSEASATEAASLLKNSTVPEYRAIIYNTLGNSYDQLFEYQRALQYYTAALRHTRDSLSRSIISNNIGYVYMEQKDYASAIKILKPLLEVSVLLKDTLSYAKVVDNLGYCYYKTGYAESLELLDKALKMRTPYHVDFELISSYLHLSEYFISKDPSLSHQYALMAYESATKANSVDDRIATLRNLITITSGDTSRQYALIRLNLTDSIGKVRQMAKNQFAKIRYDDKQTREENALLRYQKEKMNLYIIILIGLSVILILLVFIIRYRRRSRHEREKLEAAYAAEVRIGRKIHDELANDLYNTMTFTQTQDLAEPSKKEALLRYLDRAYERARNISRENSEVATDESFSMQLLDLLNEYNSPVQKVILRGFENFHWHLLSKPKKAAVYRVLQELMVNMKKHSDSKVAILQFEKDDKYTSIRYSDNGIGVDLNNNFSKNGLRNVENRIYAIGGTVTFESEPENGFRVSVSFPTAN